MRFRLLVVALICTRLSSVAAQSPSERLDAYDRAVQAYRTGGDLTAAVTPLRDFNSKDFNAAVKRIITGRDRAVIEAAAVFELEVGIGLMGLAPAAAEGHFRLGEALTGALIPPKTEQWGLLMEQFETFRSTFYGVAGSAFLAATDPMRARTWIQKARSIRPDSPVFRTLDGAMHELSAAQWNPDLLPPSNAKTRAQIERRRLLGLAEDSYREALRANPSYVLAEIRLGRVQFLKEDYAEARTTLEAAEKRTQELPHRYLAALFLGGACEHLKDVNAARSAYERALDVVPQSQAAVVALSHLESAAGRVDRAQTLARGFAKFTSVDDRHWWAYKNGGLDEKGLEALRAKVRR